MDRAQSSKFKDLSKYWVTRDVLVELRVFFDTTCSKTLYTVNFYSLYTGSEQEVHARSLDAVLNKASTLTEKTIGIAYRDLNGQYFRWINTFDRGWVQESLG